MRLANQAIARVVRQHETMTRENRNLMFGSFVAPACHRLSHE